VVDDGGGFASGDVRASALGLVGMQERAEIIGGRLERESSPGGTAISLGIPLEPERR
jgi:signal transduction histidine kinase